ncbi:hypothetical protein, partial [Mesorhizobium sp. Primo-A]|uniref:hypothetical protein n=1 Tax=Mesorhizobium sp. Primo-A TaxID=2496780 RepID=UPI0013E3B416
ISRSNLLTHVAETSAPFDGALFVALIDAWAAFDTHEILKSLTRVHKAAAFPAPAEKMVGDLVQELRRNQAERATASFADQPDQAAATMKKAVSAILMDPDPKRIEAAEILLSEYSKQIDRSIQNRRNAIFETLEALLKNTSGVNDISKFKS